ncbi:SRPBCC domain-containing protein [Litoreibacter arenae]|uniref:Activator of Hsp90 ATPase 1 family protein n=1 Tax=Litoreibacter arenae DSM 19593 TaxID=1123360 RepID=S9RJC4_9RHOB|nr:SRPBCC domain-containing protein [Litoreibacter arenae]EPX78210.1 Activator of Hsp90 ATPase 1 family protein [Litoreibacter arenae DSM 19593]
MNSITRSITVPASPAQAWERFVDGLHLWWDTEHCHCSEENLERVFIDPAQGQWGEITKTGEVVSWGFAIEVKPERKLSLAWQMDPLHKPWIAEVDPDRASLIDVTFAPMATGTRVTVEHYDFDRHGDGAQAMKDVMIGLDRWQEWLGLYAASFKSPD